MTHVQWVSLAGSLLFLAMVLEAVRRQRLREAYALLWIASAAGMVVLTLRINLLRWISDLVGIEYPPATLFLLLIIGILLLLFQYSIVISTHNEKIRTLTQDIALLRQELEEYKRSDASCPDQTSR